jgi:hypothetical protein
LFQFESSISSKDDQGSHSTKMAALCTCVNVSTVVRHILRYANPRELRHGGISLESPKACVHRLFVTCGGTLMLTSTTQGESRGTGVWLMLKAQLEAEIEQARERIRKTRESNFDQDYKDSWIAANENHIKICQGEIKALERLFKVDPKP